LGLSTWESRGAKEKGRNTASGEAKPTVLAFATRDGERGDDFVAYIE